ncbi:hypothetical protein [Aliirhizobium cellulosilyticum]|uniref:Uncharacterized protein n=1 Tax=Aliirhizobium cellulosilyticum TaxID=393664 RepID=A0A7W6X944_9HYPH|nr:hypothetical protein [Rhizobium cellulosilyticum]MBB4348007.1 hypothetical protein [Rhizobium cellulosilyticum]MBB4409599.1 hypothetical protein [Rhizobium cellulosilyticum]
MAALIEIAWHLFQPSVAPRFGNQWKSINLGTPGEASNFPRYLSGHCPIWQKPPHRLISFIYNMLAIGIRAET